MSTKSVSLQPKASVWPYLWLGITAHLLWGSYPVFAKRAMAEVPKFSLLLVASLAAASVGAMLLHWRDGMRMRQVWDILRRDRVLWGLAFFVVVRSVTNLISIELTQAVWVQLINILTPFPVALLGVWFFDQPVPHYTYRALVLSTLGAVLMLVQDWSQVWAGFTLRDGLGLLMAVFSTLALATYFQMVRRSRLRQASGGLIMFQQGIAMALTYLVLSVGFGESWGAWGTVSAMGWLAIFGVVGLAQVVGNLVQIVALGGANPALVTSLMALRLVSALVLAGLILGERLVRPTQWVGMAIVVATVTGYLWMQRTEK